MDAAGGVCAMNGFLFGAFIVSLWIAPELRAIASSIEHLARAVRELRRCGRKGHDAHGPFTCGRAPEHEGGCAPC